MTHTCSCMMKHRPTQYQFIACRHDLGFLHPGIQGSPARTWFPLHMPTSSDGPAELQYPALCTQLLLQLQHFKNQLVVEQFVAAKYKLMHEQRTGSVAEHSPPEVLTADDITVVFAAIEVYLCLLLIDPFPRLDLVGLGWDTASSGCAMPMVAAPSLPHATGTNQPECPVSRRCRTAHRPQTPPRASEWETQPCPCLCVPGPLGGCFGGGALVFRCSARADRSFINALSLGRAQGSSPPAQSEMRPGYWLQWWGSLRQPGWGGRGQGVWGGRCVCAGVSMHRGAGAGVGLGWVGLSQLERRKTLKKKRVGPPGAAQSSE